MGMANDLSQSQRILSRLKSTKSGLARAVSQSATVQAVTFTGLGTAHAGSVLTSILCASSSGRDATTTSCPNIGTLLCSQVRLRPRPCPSKIYSHPISAVWSEYALAALVPCHLESFTQLVLLGTLSASTFVQTPRLLRT